MGTMPQRIAQWQPIVNAIAPLFGLDPLDVLALISRESEGGELLQPRGPGGLGDGGRGHGLTQLDSRYNATLIAALCRDGTPAWKVPEFNILCACMELAWYVHMFDGTGANPRICMLACFNADYHKVRAKLRSVTQPISDDRLVELLDPLTTGKNYVSDVLARRNSYVLSP